MTTEVAKKVTIPSPIVLGIALVVSGIISAILATGGVSVRVGGYHLIGIAAGGIATVLAVWGLFSATGGRYSLAVGALVAAAGLTLVFLMPMARSRILFGATGSLVMIAIGVFLVADSLGYDLLVVEAGETTAQQTDGQADSER